MATPERVGGSKRVAAAAAAQREREELAAGRGGRGGKAASGDGIAAMGGTRPKPGAIYPVAASVVGEEREDADPSADNCPSFEWDEEEFPAIEPTRSRRQR